MSQKVPGPQGPGYPKGHRHAKGPSRPWALATPGRDRPARSLRPRQADSTRRPSPHAYVQGSPCLPVTRRLFFAYSPGTLRTR